MIKGLSKSSPRTTTPVTSGGFFPVMTPEVVLLLHMVTALILRARVVLLHPCLPSLGYGKSIEGGRFKEDHGLD